LLQILEKTLVFFSIRWITVWSLCSKVPSENKHVNKSITEDAVDFPTIQTSKQALSFKVAYSPASCTNWSWKDILCPMLISI